MVASIDGAMCWKSGSVITRQMEKEKKQHNKKCTEMNFLGATYPYSGVAEEALDPTGLAWVLEQTFSPLADRQSPCRATRRVQWPTPFSPMNWSLSMCHFRFRHRT